MTTLTYTPPAVPEPRTPREGRTNHLHLYVPKPLMDQLEEALDNLTPPGQKANMSHFCRFLLDEGLKRLGPSRENGGHA